MTIKKISIIFNQKSYENTHHYSLVEISNSHTSFLTDNDMLNPEDPEFVKKCMSSIKPLLEDPNWKLFKTWGKQSEK